MNEAQIFKGITNLTPFKLAITDSFPLYTGENKSLQDNRILNVNGYAYYSCEKPKAKTDCYRYYLELDINKTDNDKTLVVLMLNPSNTFPQMDGKKSKVDDTIKNTVRIAYKAGYAKVIILNSFNFIDGNSLTAIKSVKENSDNMNIKLINNVLDIYNDLMIAWGTKIRKKNKVEILSTICDHIPKINLYAYAWNSHSNCPYHPATRVDNMKKNERPLTNFLKGDGQLKKLDIIKEKDKFDLVVIEKQ